MDLYHYYDKRSGPFRSVTAVPSDRGNTILDRMKHERPDSMCAKRNLDYIEKRKRCEAILKREFEAKGGIIDIDSPYYMVVEHSPWLSTWYEQGDFIKIPIEELDVRKISFTYGDSMPTFSPSVDDGKEYRGQVYTYDEILEIIDKYGLPQDWNDDGSHGPERYIEAHVWTHLGKIEHDGKSFYPDLEAYIDEHYVEPEDESEPESDKRFSPFNMMMGAAAAAMPSFRKGAKLGMATESAMFMAPSVDEDADESAEDYDEIADGNISYAATLADEDHQRDIDERIEHLSDPFSVYLMYLIEQKGLSNADVYKRAIVDKKVFSKIKNNPDYHPQKMTAMCLCVGAMLNIDESIDLLGRAGYALSPSDKTDVIFRYFIENEIYDMIELDIQLEEHGLKCLIS